MLARDIALAKERPLLKDLVLVFAPIFNADGNEKMAKQPPRTGRSGPRRHPRQRPGTRPQPRFRQARKSRGARPGALPEQVGPRRRHRLPHDQRLLSPLHPHLRGRPLPGRRRPRDRLRARRDAARRRQAPGEEDRLQIVLLRQLLRRPQPLGDRRRRSPRYGTHYVGLRNRIAILSESYSYASFKDRVLASKAFVREHLRIHRREQGQDPQAARPRPATPRSRRARNRRETTWLSSAQKAAAVGRPVTFSASSRSKRTASVSRPTSRTTTNVIYMGGSEPTLSVRRPYAYLFPAALRQGRRELAAARHRGRGTARGHRVGCGSLQDRQDHADAGVSETSAGYAPDATVRKESRRVEAGTILVRTAQPLGTPGRVSARTAVGRRPGDLELLRCRPRGGQGLSRYCGLPAPAPITSGRVRPLAGGPRHEQADHVRDAVRLGDDRRTSPARRRPG